MPIFLICLLWATTMHSAKAQRAGDEILWDSYGVPHIYSNKIDGMYYEFGWAQMHNHANLILRLYGQARGRAAEYWGENYLASDRQVRLFRLPELAEKQYKFQDSLFRTYLDSFVSGINAYSKLHPEAIDAGNRQVLPITPEDVLAHGIRVVFLRFVAGENLGMASRKVQPGSNSIAIGPSRSASNHALLLANPHLPWGDLFTFFEAHLQAPGFNAYGASIVGLPVLSIAFNDHLGWTHTVNPISACNRYELSVQGEGYMLDSVVVPFEKRSATIKVKQNDSTIKQQIITFLYSRHGPIVGIKDDKAYAIRIAGMDNPSLFYQWHLMAMATDYKQFEKALRMMQLPMFNVIYADKAGNIFYLFDGNIPKRTDGDWAFWNAAVDGQHSRYIWQGTLPYDSLPKLFDPATGFIQNANDPPWNCTSPPLIDPDKFPSYISSRGMSMRPQRAVNMIRHDHFVSMDRLMEYKLNTGMEAADRFLPDLLMAVTRFPDSIASRAALILKAWDKSTDAGSRGAVLFTRWFDKLQNDMFSTPWQPDHPTETPAGLNDSRLAVELLAKAAQEVEHDYGSLDIAWGDVYRFRLGQMDLPANGGPEQYGIYRTIYYTKDKDNRYRAVAGDSYVSITEFGSKVKARVLLSYGNSTQQGSKHLGDQLSLLSRKELRTAWLEKSDILKHLEEREQF
jgi:acyl-homoserine-lactone acylase